MYNTQKLCKCGWRIVYDEKNNHHRYNEYKYCPICKSELEKKGWSPDI